MLVLVLLLIIAACGALAASVALAQPEWSWLSVLLCAVGVVVLIVESARRRRREASSPSAEHSASVAESSSEEGTRAVRRAASGDTASGHTARSGRTNVPGRTPPSDDTAGQSTTTSGTRITTPVPAADPGEENVDPADLRQLGLSEVSVVVVDEHPRYHLDTCDWLDGRTTIPLPFSEARELGFTPCARCMPVALLANRQRV